MANSKETLFSKFSRPKKEAVLRGRGLRFSWNFKIIIFLMTLSLCTFFFAFRLDIESKASKAFNVSPGSIWSGETITADIPYPIFKTDDELSKEKDEVRRSTLQIFLLKKTEEQKTNNNLQALTGQFLDSANEINENVAFLLSEKNLKPFLEFEPAKQRKELQKIDKVLTKFFEQIYKNGFIDVSTEFINHNEISVRLSNNTEAIFQKTGLTDSSMLIDKARQYIGNRLSAESAALATEIVMKSMRPNFVYSLDLSEQFIDLRVATVPTTEGVVRQGEVIVAKGQKVTKSIQKKLSSFERSKYMRSDTGYSIWLILGSFGHSLTILLILYLYLYYIRRRIFNDNYQLLVVVFAIGIVSLLSWLSIEIPSTQSIEYLIFLPAFSMLIAIVFDSRTAFYVSVTMALLVSGIRGNDYITGTTMLFAGTLAAYTVRDIQSRTQMFKSIFFIFIGFIIPITAFGIERSEATYQIGYRLGFATINAAVSPLITFGLLFILERISSFTTDLKLQEYSNLNHPLLLKMNEIAPGSYQHTLSLAVLAEKCAAAVNANQLLAKVGAYFHDIGKIANAEYYVENQINMGNKHDQLTPQKSAEAIKKHVSQGIKLGQEYKLPQRIVDFIPMHHGTMLIKHFYAKALEESAGEQVNEEDFRYPGPKPQNKETAIVMICDSAEAISRLGIKENKKLEKLLDDIIKDRLLDGQFDESNLTFRDLQTIKSTCLKNLIGVSHPRVKYKQIPPMPEDNHEDEIDK